jgi:hypothetical protein
MVDIAVCEGDAADHSKDPGCFVQLDADFVLERAAEPGKEAAVRDSEQHQQQDRDRPQVGAHDHADQEGPMAYQGRDQRP